MSKKLFEMNGKQYTSMVAIAKDLGKSRIYPKDFPKFGITEITEENKIDEVKTLEEVSSGTQIKNETDKASAKKEKKSNKASTEVKEVKEVKEDYSVEDIIKLQKTYDITEFSKMVSKSSIPSLVALAQKFNLKVWEDITNEAIKRMRLIMVLKEHFYPGEKLPAKTSTWGGVPTEKMIELAKKHNLEYRISKESRTTRMWVAKALNDANLTSKDLPEEVGE